MFNLTRSSTSTVLHTNMAAPRLKCLSGPPPVTGGGKIWMVVVGLASYRPKVTLDPWVKEWVLFKILRRVREPRVKYLPGLQWANQLSAQSKDGPLKRSLFFYSALSSTIYEDGICQAVYLAVTYFLKKYILIIF